MDIIAASLRPSTQKQYNVYIQQWMTFCDARNIDYVHTTVNSVIAYLTYLFHERQLSYSAINTARSALSSFVILQGGSNTVGSHPFIIRFMRGVYNLRPTLPRYTEIWDVRVVLNLLRKMSPAYSLGLKELTLKLAMLIALVSGQRVQTLQKLSITEMDLKLSSATFSIKQVKQSRPGSNGFVVKLRAYPAERKLCVLTYLKQYLSLTKRIRSGEKALFISFRKPHKAVSKDTIARWLKFIMKKAGLDSHKYTAHSTRSASTSAASAATVPVDDILQTAGWASETTFRRFYKKPVCKENSFADAVLKRK